MNFRKSRFSGSLLLSTLLPLIPLSANVFAQETSNGYDWTFIPEQVKTEYWECKFCPEKTAWTGELDLGAGYLTEDDPLFQNVIASDNNSSVLLLDGWAKYQANDGHYLKIKGNELGMETRSIEFKTGQLNNYSINFNFRQLHKTAGEAYSAFINPEEQQLLLPENWLNGATTQDMNLENLYSYTLQTERDRYELNLFKIFDSGEIAGKWITELHASHEEKTATTLSSASFLTYSTQLPEAQQQTTALVTALLGYQAKNWQLDFSYDGSFFANKNNSLYWENPYETIVGGATAGRMNSSPDNKFNQLSIKGFYQLPGAQLQASVARGKMTQDEIFTPYTINSQLTTEALPSRSADAAVDTLNIRFQVNSKLSRAWRVSAKYKYDDRDNNTEQHLYTPIVTDSYAGAAQKNTVYSFTTERLDLEAKWRINRQYRLRFGYDYREDDRSFQEREQTIDEKLWASLQARQWRYATLNLDLASYSRDGSGYNQLENANSPQNPLLQKYNLADRDRREIGMKFKLTPANPISASLNIYAGEDDYHNSILGLSKASDKGLEFDVAYQLSQFATAYLFSQWQWIDSKQLGSNTFSTTDWSGTNSDTTNTAGFGISHDNLFDDRVKMGIDYINSHSVGETRAEHLTATAIDNFPDIVVLSHSVEAYALYDFTNALAIRVDLRYERYKDKDWKLDGIQPDSIANVLTSNLDNSDYNGLYTGVSARYRF